MAALVARAALAEGSGGRASMSGTRDVETVGRPGHCTLELLSCVCETWVSGCACAWQGWSRQGPWPPPPREECGGLTAAFCTETGAPALLPYQFRMEEIEGFRYRCRVSGVGVSCGVLAAPGPMS